MSALPAASAALKGLPAAIHGSTRTPRSSPARPAQSKRSGSTPGAGCRGRPKGAGKRRDHASALVAASPGITVAQLAKQMGMKQHYLYGVLPRLEEEGLVVRDGRGMSQHALTR